MSEELDIQKNVPVTLNVLGLQHNAINEKRSIERKSLELGAKAFLNPRRVFGRFMKIQQATLKTGRSIKRVPSSLICEMSKLLFHFKDYLPELNFKEAKIKSIYTCS